MFRLSLLIRFLGGFVFLFSLVVIISLATRLIPLSSNSPDITYKSSDQLLENTLYPAPYPGPQATPSLPEPTPVIKSDFIGPDCVIDHRRNLSLALPNKWFAHISKSEQGPIEIFNYNPQETKYDHGKPINLPENYIKIEVFKLRLDSGQTLETWIKAQISSVNNESANVDNLNAKASESYALKLGYYSGFAYAVTDDADWDARVIGLEIDEESALIINIFPANSLAFPEALLFLSTINTAEKRCNMGSNSLDRPPIFSEHFLLLWRGCDSTYRGC